MCQGGQYLGRVFYVVERIGYKVRTGGYMGRLYVWVIVCISGVVH